MYGLGYQVRARFVEHTDRKLEAMRRAISRRIAAGRSCIAFYEAASATVLQRFSLGIDCPAGQEAGCNPPVIDLRERCGYEWLEYAIRGMLPERIQAVT